MKNSEKNSSKQVNSVNNETLSVESIKAQLKAACKDMNAAQTKDYIKSLDGYELRLTGQKPTQHYTVFFGEVRICNVEQVQGIKADGTARGCVSVAKVNFADAVLNVFESKYKKFENDFTEVEKNGLQALKYDFADVLAKIQCVFETCNNRIAEQAKAAAERAKAEAKAAAKLKRDTEKGKKAAEKLDNSTLLQVLIAKGINEVEAKKLLNIA